MEVRPESIYQLGLSFFGLTYKDAPIVRQNLFTQIHEICFHGQGGYDWNTVYNMPRWLRLFTFDKINEFYKEKNKPTKTPGKTTHTLMDSLGNVDKSKIPKPSNKPKSKVSYK